MKIAINTLHPCYNHPFKVIDNAEMDDLVSVSYTHLALKINGNGNSKVFDRRTKLFHEIVLL